MDDDELEDMEAWIDAPELKSSKKIENDGEDYVPLSAKPPPEAELFDQSYIETDRRRPPVWLLVLIVLLILSVFWKKTIYRFVQGGQNPAVELPVKAQKPY
ncbi:MAG: hypothetical protein ACTHOO_05245 [Alcanivorax sp.]